MSNAHKNTHQLGEMQRVIDTLNRTLRAKAPEDFDVYFGFGADWFRVSFSILVKGAHSHYVDEVVAPTLSGVLMKFHAVDWQRQRHMAKKFAENYAA